MRNLIKTLFCDKICEIKDVIGFMFSVMQDVKIKYRNTFEYELCYRIDVSHDIKMKDIYIAIYPKDDISIRYTALLDNVKSSIVQKINDTQKTYGIIIKDNLRITLINGNSTLIRGFTNPTIYDQCDFLIDLIKQKLRLRDIITKDQYHSIKGQLKHTRLNEILCFLKNLKHELSDWDAINYINDVLCEFDEYKIRYDIPFCKSIFENDKVGDLTSMGSILFQIDNNSIETNITY